MQDTIRVADAVSLELPLVTAGDGACNVMRGEFLPVLTSTQLFCLPGCSGQVGHTPSTERMARSRIILAASHTGTSQPLFEEA